MIHNLHVFVKGGIKLLSKVLPVRLQALCASVSTGASERSPADATGAALATPAFPKYQSTTRAAGCRCSSNGGRNRTGAACLHPVGIRPAVEGARQPNRAAAQSLVPGKPASGSDRAHSFPGLLASALQGRPVLVARISSSDREQILAFQARDQTSLVLFVSFRTPDTAIFIPSLLPHTRVGLLTCLSLVELRHDSRGTPAIHGFSLTLFRQF